MVTNPAALGAITSRPRSRSPAPRRRTTVTFSEDAALLESARRGHSSRNSTDDPERPFRHDSPRSKRLPGSRPLRCVESRKGAGPGPTGSRRFPSPLIEPDMRISRIRLSDRLHRKLTEVAQGEHLATAARPTSRTQSHPRRWCSRQMTTCGDAGGTTERARRRNGRQLDKPSAASRNRTKGADIKVFSRTNKR
jgi:hypothetical protein